MKRSEVGLLLGAGSASNRHGELQMIDHTEFLPAFLVNVRRDESHVPYIVSCSMVGQVIGFSGVVRRFANSDDLRSAIIQAGVPLERFEEAIVAADEVGRTASFSVDLNEAQKLSLIQTDSTE